MMSKFGYAEREARVAIYLEEAERLLTELTEEDDSVSDLGNIIWKETHTREHFRALHRQLGVFVLRRDYPEGWGYVHLRGDGEKDQD